MGTFLTVWCPAGGTFPQLHESIAEVPIDFCELFIYNENIQKLLKGNKAMTEITKEQLEKEAIAFNNEHDLDREAFEIVLDFNQISTWDNPFKLFVNGELKASFKQFSALKRNAEKLILENDLQLVTE